MHMSRCGGKVYVGALAQSVAQLHFWQNQLLFNDVQSDSPVVHELRSPPIIWGISSSSVLAVFLRA